MPNYKIKPAKVNGPAPSVPRAELKSGKQTHLKGVTGGSRPSVPDPKFPKVKMPKT
jgi:hypothetical protein